MIAVNRIKEHQPKTWDDIPRLVEPRRDDFAAGFVRGWWIGALAGLGLLGIAWAAGLFE